MSAIINISGLASVWVMAFSLFAAARVLRVRSGATDIACGALRFTAIIMVAMAITGSCILATGNAGAMLLPITFGVWWRLAWQDRRLQKEGLLSALSLAVEQGMPLAPMATAFADEQTDSFGARVRRFAKSLHAGASLKTASWLWPGLLPPQTHLVCAIAEQTGDLGGALRATSYGSTFDRTIFRVMTMRVFYLVNLIGALLFLLMFFAVSVKPQWNRIYLDFTGTVTMEADTAAYLASEPLLEGTSIGFWVTNLNSSFPANPVAVSVMFLAFWTNLGVLGLLVYAWLQWRGTMMPRLPIWKKIVNGVDMAQVLRIVALTAQRQRPLRESLAALAEFHPKRSVRRKMRRAARHVDRGKSWQESLKRCGLLSAADVALVSAAERNHNLPWALTVMADTCERRASYRMQAISQWVMPLAILPLGIMVAGVVISYFVPLVILVKDMST